MACNFSEQELDVLRIVQDNLPDSLEPYAEIAKMSGMTEEDVIQFLNQLKSTGAIRRFGASIKHQKTGWSYNAMVAWKATEKQAEECGPIAAKHSHISHSYYRPSSAKDWPYTLYTMIHGRNWDECLNVVEELRLLWELQDYAILRSIKELKKTSMTYFPPEDSSSIKLFEKACNFIPGGVNSPVRACHNVDSVPVFIDHAKGGHIFDIDGKEYIDFVLSWGPMILGHADESVSKSLEKAVLSGTSYGAPCPDEVLLAEEVISCMPSLEMVRMVNSGTEATMSALRLARAVTGKQKLLKFIGCYHGHADPFLAAAGSGVATFSIPGTPGVSPSVVSDTLLAPYNDLDTVKKCFDKYGSDIAAIIVEPIAANMGLVLPKDGFLEGLREITKKYNSLLIFDEVITGFRVGLGGAQKRFNIDPDLTTFGKIIGGGLPVGAFGGKSEYMKKIAPVGEVYQAGTLSGNPLAMAAGLATIKKLKTMDYNALEKKTEKFANELEKILKSLNVPVQVVNIASMFCIFFGEHKINDFSDVLKCDQKLFTTFYKHMRKSGIYLAPSAFETGMVSFAHTDEDFDRALEATKKVKF